MNKLFAFSYTLLLPAVMTILACSDKNDGTVTLDIRSSQVYLNGDAVASTDKVLSETRAFRDSLKSKMSALFSKAPKDTFEWHADIDHQVFAVARLPVTVTAEGEMPYEIIYETLVAAWLSRFHDYLLVTPDQTRSLTVRFGTSADCGDNSFFITGENLPWDNLLENFDSDTGHEIFGCDEAKLSLFIAREGLAVTGNTRVLTVPPERRVIPKTGDHYDLHRLVGLLNTCADTLATKKIDDQRALTFFAGTDVPYKELVTVLSAINDSVLVTDGRLNGAGRTLSIRKLKPEGAWFANIFVGRHQYFLGGYDSL